MVFTSRQKMVAEGAEALPARIAIVTGKGRGKDDDGASAAREAVAAILTASSSPFQARVFCVYQQLCTFLGFPGKGIALPMHCFLATQFAQVAGLMASSSPFPARTLSQGLESKSTLFCALCSTVLLLLFKNF